MSSSARLSYFFLFCVFAVSANVFAQEKPDFDRSRPRKSTTGAVFRSMAIPGWGQFYNESYYKAIVFAVIQGFQIDGIIRTNDEMNAAKTIDSFPEHYEEGTDEWWTAVAVNNKAGEDVIRARERRNKTIWWFVGMTMLSMGDAYVDAQLFGVDVSPDLTFKQDMTVGVIASFNF